MLSALTRRPRDVNTPRAAGILYGDWGTSKAYVIGLAFAIGGYSSFWLILAVSIFSVLIAINYITICKYYPNGGGVYASVRHRSEALSMMGAFFLIADYGVTAALSALSAFQYFGVSDPVLFAAIALFLVMCLNFYGPKKTGEFAFVIGIGTLFILLVLAVISLPHLADGIRNLKPLSGNPLKNWNQFVGVIVALSGIEAIANATGVMRLDPGSTMKKPRVVKTSRGAILLVMVEVAILTTLFSLAITAIDGLVVKDGSVFAASGEEIRDYVLRFLGESFAAPLIGPTGAAIFGGIISVFVALLLLSAVNTAMTGLISLQYLMASDAELPKFFGKLNKLGVPYYAVILAGLVPICLVLLVRDIAGLAELYAIGFVGAIATNLGSTSTDYSLPLSKKERGLMFFAFVVMVAIELTLFVDKPHARNYVLAITALGLLLRALSKEAKEKTQPKATVYSPVAPGQPAYLCPARRLDKHLTYALQKATKQKVHIYVLFIREQKVIAEQDLARTWEEDREAVKFFSSVQHHMPDLSLLHFRYAVTDAPASTIVEYATRLQVSQLIMGLPEKSSVFHLLTGNLVRDVRNLVPEDIQVILIS